MVNINLYKKKKPKLKLTTILVLIGVFLLPVLALRLTIENLKQTNLAEIRGKYQYARSFIGEDDITGMTNRIKSENITIVNKSNSIKTEMDSIKRDLIYAGLSTDFISELGVQYDRVKSSEKVFIESMKIIRGEDFFVKYYNVNGGQMANHKFSEGLKTAYKANGLTLTDKRMTIDFMLVNILQEELTAKTANY